MSENTQIVENPTQTLVKRGRGRPPGSKNKVSKSALPVNKAIKLNPEPVVTTFKEAAAEVAKDDKNSPKAKAERLNALLRVTDGKYNTLDDKEYRSRIEHMTLTDLQDECMRVGLKPNVTVETKQISIGTLMDLFYENKRSFVPDESGQDKTVLSEDKREALLELMKVAR